MLKLTDITWLYQHLPMRFSLTVERGEQVAILGPSGAGKSTLLNLIAGFLTPASGSLTIDGVDHTTTPPSRRPVSMLFQENNLFSHLTVAQNIGLGLNPGLKLNAAQQEKMHAIARQMGIDNLMARLPENASDTAVRALSLTWDTNTESTTLYSACTSMEIIIGMLSLSKSGLISMVPMMFSRTSAGAVCD